MKKIRKAEQAAPRAGDSVLATQELAEVMGGTGSLAIKDVVVADTLGIEGSGARGIQGSGKG